MARLKFSKETTTPATPPAGFVTFYAQGADLKYIDEAGTIKTLATGVTPEDVEDIVGTFIQSSASIQWTYNDAANTLTGVVLAAGVNHNALQNYVANQHIDHSSVSINPGTGLTGGGDITTSRTLSLGNTSVTAASYGSASQVGTFTVDAQGRLTAAANASISVTSAAVSDFTEAAQDAVGSALTDSSSVDFTYNDAGNTITAAVLPAGVNHNALQNYVANQHVDHSAVSISAGAGLTGGGDITANRTISMPNVGTAGTYGSASAVPVITTDAQGRVSGATNTTISVASTQVSDFAEAVDDRVASLIVAGAGISATYNDPANTLTIASTITQYTDEQAQDATAALIQNGTGVSWSYNDIANTLTPTVTLAPFSTTNLAEGSNLYFTDERAQDAVGNILTDTTSVDFTYNDAGNTISAAVLPAGVNHNALQNYVANQHIDHSAVSINPGTGLTGGGDITASRTLSIANTAVTAGTYGASGVPQFTVNAQGQITAASNGPALVIGDNFEQFLDDTTFTTTSNANQVAASFTTSTKQPGLYRIQFNWVYSISATTSDVIFGIYVDNVLIDGEYRQEVSETTNQRIPWTYTTYETFSGTTTHTIELRTRNETSGPTISVFFVRAEIWRVS